MDKLVFYKYFQGNLTGQEEKNLLDWVSQNETNLNEFLNEKKLWDMLLLNFDDNTANNMTKLKPEQKTFVNRISYIGKIAAIIILAFGVGWYSVYQIMSNRPGKNNFVEVPIGQRVLLTLSDGSKIWLNAKSKFSFPDRFSKKERIVELDGEALFEVAHNKNSPFYVKTPKYKIKVVGTRFNVYGYKNSNYFETTLVEGKIQLFDSNNKLKHIELSPNEQFIDDSNNNPIIKHVVPLEYITWINGVFAFNDQPFSSIVQRLERYYEVKIIVNYSDLLNYRFTGKFRYSDSLDIILDVIKNNKRFKYTKKDNIYIIDK